MMEFPDPLEYPPRLRDDGVAVQLYVVLLTNEVRLVEAMVPAHRVCAEGVATAGGIGLTVTTTWSGVPLHVFAVGVTV